MSDESQLNLLLQLEDEVARWRRRTMVLVSIFLHILLILLLVVAPDLFRRGAEMMGVNVEVKPKRESTMLFIPPDLLKRLREPPPDARILSDKNRRAQGRSPVINPKGLRMPYSRGNTPLPELKGGGPPPAPTPAPPARSRPELLGRPRRRGGESDRSHDRRAGGAPRRARRRRSQPLRLHPRRG